ncbi:mannosyl-3-phosphoglycerate phosphatase family [[Leptolyngbya] sp. PCC 7376]|uniref:HAD-IIB family hydrolase n=1 Tax=[Leptolyngbya] sp. PCC 7376 TaxID=111781 RepID=UPI00029F2946|nr:HAD-IIB family hydrolase [[Leptolyngbya] sp. PCC 7376]AFY36814.1 mannosyl-3-phosphoglycerate phosphatase family [[Leptolyngbya] sp. PCC 7376]
MFLCFSDLDGTLLNHDDYRYDAAIPTIKKLQAAGIPVMPTTSKTKAEVIDLRAALGLNDPFIVENGSGIFLELDDKRFDFQSLAIAENLSLNPIDGLNTVTLGVTYEQARQGLKHLSEEIDEILKGFGDLTIAELQAVTDLPENALKRACDRQFSEPFIRPKTSVDTLEAIAKTANFKILVGNRFCHLLGAGAAKGRAVQLMTKAWQLTHSTEQKITTIGLGDSPNDLSMLQAVDVPIVVPGVKGAHPNLIPYIEKYGWQIAPATGCLGWSAAVEKAIASL